MHAIVTKRIHRLHCPTVELQVRSIVVVNYMRFLVLEETTISTYLPVFITLFANSIYCRKRAVCDWYRLLYIYKQEFPLDLTIRSSITEGLPWAYVCQIYQALSAFCMHKEITAWPIYTVWVRIGAVKFFAFCTSMAIEFNCPTTCQRPIESTIIYRKF